MLGHLPVSRRSVLRVRSVLSKMSSEKEASSGSDRPDQANGSANGHPPSQDKSSQPSDGKEKETPEEEKVKDVSEGGHDKEGDGKNDANKGDGKEDAKNDENKDKPRPAGGFDKTPTPKLAPGYTLRFTFYRATNLPMADINSLSSDPFVTAELYTDLPLRHKEDPRFIFRTPTIRKNTNPEWNCSWVVGNVPSSGFMLKARIYDEDPADHDDRLGNVHVTAFGISESWPGIAEQGYKIKKRSGSKRAYLVRGCAAMFSRGLHMSGQLFLGVEMLGRTQQQGGRIFTIGPQYWTQHFSPMIGRLAGVKEPGKMGKTEQYK